MKGTLCQKSMAINTGPEFTSGTALTLSNKPKHSVRVQHHRVFPEMLQAQSFFLSYIKKLFKKYKFGNEML